MTNRNLKLPWMQPGWLEQASAWIQAELECRNIGVQGTIEQPHVRPWSTVLRLPTSEGDVYFKAASPALAHEPALTQALWRWRPDCMPQVLAADPERGWMLMLDMGVSLRSLIQATEDVDRSMNYWKEILPLYAEVQIEMSGRLGQLLALGILDRRLAALPAQYEQLLADTDALGIGLPHGLTAEEHQRLRDFKPQFIQMYRQLAGYDLPQTLHHDDFHDGNIFVHHGRYILSDWAESCAAHPFFTLVVTLRSVAYTLKLEANDGRLKQLRDVYLESWTPYESRQNLLAAFALAQRLGTVCRALTWYQVVSNLEEPFKAEHAGAVPGWLQEFLNFA